jgi:hypothetical protein
MAEEKKYPVSLIVRAVDKITGPLAKITAKLNGITAPMREGGKRLRAAFGQFSEAAGLKTLANGFTGFGGAMKNVASEAFSLGARLFALAGAAGFAMFSIVKGAVDAGDELATLSDRAKVGVDWFASMRHAAAQADVEQEQFNGAIDKFVKNLGDMKANGGQFLSFLNKVSPKLAQQVRGAKNTEEAFSMMTDAFKRIDDPAKLAALGAATFGKAAGPAMANFLHQGSAAIQSQQLEYLRLAGSQEEFARGASELDNAMRETETAFMGLRSAALAPLMPVFAKLAKAVTDFIVKNRDGIRQWAEGAAQAIAKWIDGGGIERLVAGVKDLAATISRFVDMVGGWKVALGGLALFMAGPLISALVSVVPAVYALGAALLTTPVGWFLVAIAAIAGAAYLIYENWAGIRDFFTLTWDAILNMTHGFQLLVAGLMTWDLGKIIQGWTQSVYGLRTALASILSMVSVLPGGAAAIGLLNAVTPGGLAGMLTPGGAEAARPAPPAAGLQSTEARVSVDFSNLPAGARVTQDKRSTQPVDVSAGYSMASY